MIAAGVDLSEREWRCFETVRLPRENARSTSTDVADQGTISFVICLMGRPHTWSGHEVHRHPRERIPGLFEPILEGVLCIVGLDRFFSHVG